MPVRGRGEGGGYFAPPWIWSNGVLAQEMLKWVFFFEIMISIFCPKQEI